MNRKDVVQRLIKEGITNRTLATMSDKQLKMLADRFLSEQTQLSAAPVNVSKTDVKTITSLKQQKKPFATYEGQSEVGESKKDSTEKDAIIKRLKFKIAHETDKKKVADAKEQLARLTKKKEVDEGKFKSKSEWLKSKGIIKGNKKETTETSDVEEPEPEHKKEKKKEKTTKGQGGAEYEKRLAHGNAGFSLNEQGIFKKKSSVVTSSQTPQKETVRQAIERMSKMEGYGTGTSMDQMTAKKKAISNATGRLGKGGSIIEEKMVMSPDGKSYVCHVVLNTKSLQPQGSSLQEWVNKVVKKNYHPFTSKNEIMELIQVKLTEERPQEAPHTADPDIDVKPGKREAPGIDPDDPFRDPHPGINPNPKAKKKKKISAEDAKEKIIALLKDKLFEK